MGLGEIIKTARTGLNMSQKQLANEIGCAEITIRQYESGRREPSYDTCLKLENALGIALVAHSPSERIAIDVMKVFGTDDKHIAKAAELAAYYSDSLHSSKGYSFSPIEELLISYFSQLNKDGQEFAVKQLEVISGNPQYKRNSTEETPPEDQ